MKREADFSTVHDRYIKNPDGTFSPMDEPFFETEKIAEGTWKILSSGDYSYLVEGEKDAIAVDTGYGAGNIREFLQGLTGRPVRNVVNTHGHFDHTANNGYFETAYMTEETKKTADLPFPSFLGVRFPSGSKIELVEDGDVISLGVRELLIFSLPDHAPGSIVLLDKREGLLFTGDEILPGGKRFHGNLLKFYERLRKVLEHREEFSRLCAGAGVFEAGLMDRYAECLEKILFHGLRGEPVSEETVLFPEITGPDGKPAYDRRFPHPEDIPKGSHDSSFLRAVNRGGLQFIYDFRENPELQEKRDLQKNEKEQEA